MWAYTPFFERMPDFLRIPKLIPLHAWLIEAGTNDAATETLFDGFCGRLVAAGVPIARGFLSIAGLHPLRRAYSLTWNDGRIVEVTNFGHATMATALWQTSPFRHMLETKTRRLHRRLVGDDAVLDFEVLREFRDAGMSEWLALMYGFGWSAALPATNQFGVILSWTTSTAVGRGNGWSALELAAIEELSGTLALAIKGNTAPAAAHDLLAAYLGGDAADRVSAGQVQRGSVSRIAAALALLDKMNKGGAEGKGTPLGEVKNSLRTMNPVGNLYQSLVNRGVFQLGYKTQCTHCQRASWHSLEEFSKGLVCPLCHKHLEPISAVDTDNQGAWHLKTAGPFSISNYGDGSYCVLLGLNFFERDHSLQMTPVLSFRAKHRTSSRELEADFGIMWQETVYGETEDGVLFAECKSYNRFKKKDFERMRNLAGQFPGAILAFCTLRKKLEPGEIRELKRLAKAGMRQWKTERPINPILLLTGQELFSRIGAPHCWDGISVPEWAKRTHTVLDLCNATQSIYLGLPHWHETWRLDFESRRKRRKRRKSNPT